MTIVSEFFGNINNKTIKCFTLRNSENIEVKILTYGGIIASIKTPNKNGVSENIVLGCNSLKQYYKNNSYFGAIVGRYANRIANGKFKIDNKEYVLEKNNFPNSLHGGSNGFDKVIWKASTETNKNSVSLILNYHSKDMEEGFPGNLDVTVTYTLTSCNCLNINYSAITDKKTIVNLTNHSYFNLSANFKNDILDHQLQINAATILPVNKDLIPTGEMTPVKNTPFDFLDFKTIGKDIKMNNAQLKFGSGYDHCWVLKNQNLGTRLIASCYHKYSGRLLEVFSDKNGVQFYSGNHLSDNYDKRTGFCLETQYYPDSPNQPNFPSVILNPNAIYTSTTTFKFSVK